MNVSPTTGPSGKIPSSKPSIWEKIGRYLGHSWKMIHHLPTQIYESVLRIKNAIRERFASHPPANQASNKPNTQFEVKISPRMTPNESQKREQKEGENIKQDALSLDFEELLGVDDDLDVEEDPLKSLGIVAPQIESTDRKFTDLQGIKPDLIDIEQHNSSRIEDEVLSTVRGLLEPSQTLLCQWSDKKPENLEDYVESTQTLNDEFVSLKVYASTFKDSSPEAHKLVQKTLQELEATLTAFEEEMYKQVKHLYIEPAETILREMVEPNTFEEYFEFTEQLNQYFAPLKKFASKFEKRLPDDHQLVQNTMKALEEKVNQVERKICDQTREWFMPNPKIPGDGNCLFWSIEDNLHSTQSKQEHYRQLAADYIRSHPPQFEEGIKDVSGKAQGELAAYQEIQGGKEAWKIKLSDKLEREPTAIDFYCDCLANSSIWGGSNELLALSEQLNAPILVFTRQDDGESWRFDFKAGEEKFRDNPPILLYYNGNSHYQSLTSRFDI